MQRSRPAGDLGSGRTRRWPVARGVISLKVAGSVVGVLAVLIGAIVVFGSRGATGEDRHDIHVVSRQSWDITATANGDLRARKQTVLRSRLENDAAILEIVPEGSRVKQGDVLVRLNSDDIRSKLDDETLQLSSARSDLIVAESALEIQRNENESEVSQGRVKVELAEIELKKWSEGDLVEERLKLDLGIEKAQREHERLKTKLERSEALFKREFLSKDELDKDRLAFIEAESNLKTALLAKEVFETYTRAKDEKKLTSDLDEARAEFERITRKAESELASKDADVINKRRRLEIHEDKVNKLKAQLESSVITAPTEGLVVYASSLTQNMWMNDGQKFDVGTVIRPNQEVIILPDTREMIAAVRVQEALLSRIRIGLRALVSIDAAQGRKFDASIEGIGVMAETAGFRDPNVREYEITLGLELGGETHALKPSMRCEARIVLASVKDAMTIPVQAVFNDGPVNFVYVPSGDRFRQTQVRIARRSEMFAEVLSGLEEGVRVLLREPAPNRIIKTEFEKPAIAAGGERQFTMPAGAGGPPAGMPGRAGGGDSQRASQPGQSRDGAGAPNGGDHPRGGSRAGRPNPPQGDEGTKPASGQPQPANGSEAAPHAGGPAPAPAGSGENAQPNGAPAGSRNP